MSVQPAQSNRLDALEMAIEAEECRRSLKKFLMGCWHILEPGTPFVDGWVIDALCEHLEALVHGDITRLVINIQPRTLKSTLCSVAMPVWAWLHSPEWRFLSASYSLSLSIRDNRRKRVLIESPWFQARYGSEFALAGDQNVKSFFENDRRGYQLATSIGGTTTGQGGDYLLIDDAHNASEAYSEADREAALTFFREVWSNRLNNQATGRMLVVGQRIHDNDVCGYIFRERKDWIGLILPSEFEPARRCFTPVTGRVWKGTDPRTQEGELLWPERFNQQALDGLKRDLGSLGYAAQYQQSPVPAGGGQFKEHWFRYAGVENGFYALETASGVRHVAVKDCWRFSVVDLAISTKQSADYTVIQTYDVTPGNDLILIDQIRGHFDNPEQVRLIRSTYFRLRPQFIQIENVAYQLAIIQQLQSEPVQPVELPDNPVQVGDFLVRVASPEALDQTLRALTGLNAFVVKSGDEYARYAGASVVRVQGDIYFFKFAMEQQGYGQIVGDIRQEDIDRIEQERTRKYSIPIREYKPVRDKVARASAPALLMEQGKFYFLKTLPDLPIIKAEHLTFPKGAHDDIVDCSSQAAEVIFVPSGPIVWSPDSTPATPVAPAATAPRQGMVEVDYGTPDPQPWDYGEGEMLDFQIGGRW